MKHFVLMLVLLTSGASLLGWQATTTGQGTIQGRGTVRLVFVTAPTVPAPPTGLTATAISANQINLSWTASPGATTYNVLRSGISGGPYTQLTGGVVATSYLDTSVTAASTFFYVVQAVNAAGTSGNSNQASATTPAPPPPATCNDPGVICAQSCDQAAVAAAVGQAVAGDTVIMPIGNCHWAVTGGTGGKAINLIGADPVLTNIINDMPVATQSILVSVSLLGTSADTFRISNFTISGGINDANGNGSRTILVNTYSHNFRVDHITINNQNTVFAMQVFGDPQGVIDHFNANGNYRNGIMVQPSTNNTGPNAWGDASWAAPSSIGTSNAVYVEDSSFIYTATTGRGSVSCDVGGARIVARRDTVVMLGSHGLDTTGRPRSCRQWEVYDNDFRDQGQNSGLSPAWLIRGGTGIMFNNRFWPSPSSSAYGQFFGISVFRESAGYAGWGRCDGTGAFDSNGAVAYSGTVASSQALGTSLNNQVVITPDNPPAGWTTDQWKGYAANGLPWGASIVASDATTITVAGNANTPGVQPAIPVGQPFQIQQVNQCIDQGGVGQGLMLTGGNNSSPYTPPSLPGAAPPAFIQQIIDPVYAWGNVRTVGGVQGPINGGVDNRPNSVRTEPDKYMYNQVISPNVFDGSVGVGVGTQAEMNAITTCAPNSGEPNATGGVGFWATDVSNGQPGLYGQGELYVCKPPHQWVAHYHPYVYPHPITLLTTMSANGHVIETADGHMLVRMGTARERREILERKRREARRRKK